MADQTNVANASEKPELRVKTASTKLTESEFAELEAYASKRGQT